MRARRRRALRLAARGEWVVMGGSNAFDISHTGLSSSSAKFFDVGGELGVDAFVIRNLSIGFDAAASYSNHQGYGATTLTDTKSTQVSGGVRFGFNVPLGEWLSLYPRLTLGLDSTHSDTSSVSTSDRLAFAAVVVVVPRGPVAQSLRAAPVSSSASLSDRLRPTHRARFRSHARRSLRRLSSNVGWRAARDWGLVGRFSSARR